MSVRSEINRISGNVTAALAAIAEKGVTVDSGSNSDDLATLIAAIESGAGGKNATTGSFTTTSDASVRDYTIEHNLGVVPNLLIVYSLDAEPTITGQRYLKGTLLYCHDTSDPSTYLGMIRCKSTKTTTTWYGYVGTINGEYVVTSNEAGTNCLFNFLTDTSVRVQARYTDYETYAQGGATYNWLAAKVPDY